MVKKGEIVQHSVPIGDVQEFLNVRRFAAAADLSTKTIWRLIKAGKLAAIHSYYPPNH
jgi:hypothetical protein